MASLPLLTPLLTPPGKTQRLWSDPENPQLPNCPALRNNQKPQPLPKKEKERKPQEHSKSMSNSFAPRNKTHCGCTQSGRRLDKEEARSHSTRRFLVVSKTELSSIKTLLLLGCCGGRPPSPAHKSQNKRQTEVGRGGLGPAPSPLHTSQGSECPQISAPERAAVCYYPSDSKGPGTRERVPSR